MAYINRIILIIFILSLLIFSGNVFSQSNDKAPNLLIKYEELTSPEFIEAVIKSDSTCLIPIGVLEKHGPHLPLGTDLIDVREIALRAAKQEYTIVYPGYYFSQIFEAKHQPGTIAYSPQLILNILQETCQELARNGLKKIILVNGHGGNNHFLHFFCQIQLEGPKDYSVILFSPEDDPEVSKQISKLRQTRTGGHADEVETSMMLSHRPDLVRTEQAKNQSGRDLNRINNIPYGYTGIWWYAKFPNHYAGDGSYYNKEIGELTINSRVNQLVSLLKSLKTDKNIEQLQKKFFRESENPLETEQD